MATAVDAPRVPARRRTRTALLVSVAVGVAAALLVAVLATREPAESRLADSPLLGRPAPDFEAVALDGRTVRLRDLEGQWVVLNFFASWCIPCHREHPELVDFTARHRAVADAQVVAVIWDDSEDRVRRYFEREGGDWPVLRDPGVRIGLDYGVRGPPESYVIAPDGTVVAKFVGAVTADALDTVVAGRRLE